MLPKGEGRVTGKEGKEGWSGLIKKGSCMAGRREGEVNEQ